MKGEYRLEDFAELYKLYAQPLYRYLLYMCGDAHTAEELLAETFYQAFISIHRFKGKSKVSTWLYQISKHVYLKHYKNKAKIQLSSNPFFSNVTDATSPETVYVEREEQQQLIKAIHALKAPYKEVVILRIFNELPYKEISEIFSKSESWARVIFYRAKLQLHEQLKEVER